MGGFVADIPTDATHRSAPALRRVATALSETSLPALIIWGATDPVFQDRYLNDLRQRLPQADVHRVEIGGHLIVEDVDYAAIVLEWVSQQLSADDNSPTVNTTATITHSGHSANQPRPAGSAHEVPYQPLWEFLYRGEDSAAAALVDMSVSDRGKPFTVSWAQLSQLVAAIAQGLWDLGLRPGDRVCILVPPGRDLTAGLYALLRIGGVAVIADQGLGITGMTRAVRSANPDWIIGETPGLILARAQGWPGRRISVSTLSTPLAGVLGVEDSLYGMALREKTTTRLSALQAPTPDPESLAAILFTSGSTGPAKGVRYTHTGLSHLTQLLRDTFGVTPGASLLAGFAPFALLGPAIGATSVTPRMSVTKPATLTASALADAAIAGQSTIAFGSPAALRNVAATARELSRAQREALAGITMMLSAGAPVSQDLVRDIQVLMPQAEIHSPYGMTESLVLTDINHSAPVADTAGNPGVLVGTPAGEVRLTMAPLDDHGIPAETLYNPEDTVDQLGEIVVSASHMRQGYDALWYTTAQASRDQLDGLRWHRTGDIGHLDAHGRLWIEGRTHHVISTPAGPLGPVHIEENVAALPEVYRAAAVGHGPAGTQALVVIIEPEREVTGPIKPGLAPTQLTATVRSAVTTPGDVPVAAVLVVDSIPVDTRHNSKIDRSRLARWADRVLTGGKVGKP